MSFLASVFASRSPRQLRRPSLRQRVFHVRRYGGPIDEYCMSRAINIRASGTETKEAPLKRTSRVLTDCNYTRPIDRLGIFNECAV